jgi:hypothetical protein
MRQHEDRQRNAGESISAASEADQTLAELESQTNGADGGKDAPQSTNSDNRKQLSKFTFRHIVLSLAVATYFVLVYVWFFPPVPDAPKTIRPILATLGITQNWAMFGEVGTMDLHHVALIKFANGMMKLYEMPRMEKLSIVERYHKEKFKKYFDNLVIGELYNGIWPYECRYIARANNDPLNPPVQISLAYKYARIPENEFIPVSKVPEHRFTVTYFVYDVEPGDLRETTSK